MSVGVEFKYGKKTKRQTRGQALVFRSEIFPFNACICQSYENCDSGECKESWTNTSEPQIGILITNNFQQSNSLLFKVSRRGERICGYLDDRPE